MEKGYSKLDPISMRLIYLWAFVESGLGGLMHLFHIPLTGFIVGGFSILINVLLAKFSKSNIRTMAMALGLVLLVKFALSPQSPIGAYIAVAFQGILAMVVFRLFTVNKLTILVYSNIVMLENAIQKPLMAYIVFGKDLTGELWLSASHFFKDDAEHVLIGLIAIYLLTYIAWGIIIGVWINSSINRLEAYQLADDFVWKVSDVPLSNYSNFRRSYWKLGLGILMLIGGIILYEILPIHYFLRPLAFIILFGYALPFVFKRILIHYQSKNQTIISEILKEQTRVRTCFVLSFQYSKKYRGLARWQEFVFLATYLNLFQVHNE
jgi:hypothetical protein